MQQPGAHSLPTQPVQLPRRAPLHACCPSFALHFPALQYLAELEEKEKKGGPEAMPFGKPLAPVSASELGFSGARLDVLVRPHSQPAKWQAWVRMIEAHVRLAGGWPDHSLAGTCRFLVVSLHCAPWQLCAPLVQNFDETQHKLLCEELKHLYTGGRWGKQERDGRGVGLECWHQAVNDLASHPVSLLLSVMQR